MNYDIIDSKQIIQRNHISYLSDDFRAKNLSNSSFWYYTSIETADRILESSCFWLSSIEKMNDKNESEIHKDSSNKIHALCFCNSNSEKIPMWYLYAGITGEGIRIGLTPAMMLKYIRGIKIAYPVINGIKSETPLIVGKDVDIKVGWVFYKKEEGIVNYKHKWYRISDYGDCSFEKCNFFVKDYPWEYEREFRIVVINKTETAYHRLAIDIPSDIYKGLKLVTAPEYSDNANLSSYSGFQKYYSFQIGKSKLNIRMDLLTRNKDKIIDSKEKLIDKDNAKVIYEYIMQSFNPLLKEEENEL